MREIWISTDLHLFSKDNDYRHPFRADRENGRLADNFSSEIDSSDLFIFLGDLCDPEVSDPKKLGDVIKSIPCYKIMCRGNHDTQDDLFYREVGFDLVIDICRYHNVLFSHKPIRVQPDEVNIHGHLHTEMMSGLGPNHINAYADNWHNGGHPMRLGDLINAATVQSIEIPKKDMEHIQDKFQKYTSLDYGEQYKSFADITDWDTDQIEGIITDVGAKGSVIVSMSEAAINTSTVPKAILDLHATMTREYNYGIPINGKVKPGKEWSPSDYDMMYRIASPRQFQKQKGGVCWDYVLYEADWFSKNLPGVPYKAYYVMFDDGVVYPTHTFLTFQVGHEHFLFEVSYDCIAGIWSAPDDSHFINFIMDTMKEDNAKLNLKRAKCYVCTFDPLDPRYVGMSCVEFMDAMANWGIDQDHKYQSNYSVIKYDALTESADPDTIMDEVVFGHDEGDSDADVENWMVDDDHYQKKLRKSQSERENTAVETEDIEVLPQEQLDESVQLLQQALNESMITETTAGTQYPNITAKVEETENPNDNVSKKAVHLTFFNDKKQEVGEVSISAIDSKTPFIYDLEVKSEFRRQHYGDVIVDYIVKRYKASTLGVEKSNAAAIALYKKHGFKVTQEYKDSDRDLYYMEFQKPKTLQEMAYEDAQDTMDPLIRKYCKNFDQDKYLTTIAKQWKKDDIEDEPPRLKLERTMASDRQLLYTQPNLSPETYNNPGAVEGYWNLIKAMSDEMWKELQADKCTCITKLNPTAEDVVGIYVDVNYELDETTTTPTVLYHGSNHKYKILKAQTSFGSPDENQLFATPSYGFALAYAGQPWSDLEINQTTIGNKVILTEILPGMFDQKFNCPGFVHYVKPDTFTKFGRESEYVSHQEVPVEKVDKIDNVLSAMECNGVEFYRYPELPPYIKSHEEYIRKIIKKYHMNITYEKLEKKYHLNESIIDESWVVHKKNLQINMEDWAPGNPLWITGASGDGKSTLAKKLGEEHHAIVINSDIVLCRMLWTKEKFEIVRKTKTIPNVDVWSMNMNSPAWDYIDSHPNLPFGAKDPVTKSTIESITQPEIIAFYNWLMVELKSNPKYKNDLYIIEGCDICILDPKLMATKPLIIMGGSRIQSFMRRVSRNVEDKNTSYIESIFKYLKKYNIQAKRLDDDKDNFRKGIESVLRESIEDGMTDPTLKKFGLRDVGNTHEVEKEEEEIRQRKEKARQMKELQKKHDRALAEKKKEAARKHKIRMKAAKKARKTRLKNQRLKAKQSTVPGVKNEDFDLLDPILTVDTDRHNSPVLEMIDHVQFFDRMDETSTVKVEKVQPVYIFLTHTGTKMSEMIKKFTHDEFTHSSISFDSSMSACYTFANKQRMPDRPITKMGGFQAENLRSGFYEHRDCPWAIFMVPCTESQVKLMKKRLDYFIKNDVKFTYNVAGLATNLLGVSYNPEWSFFCSQFVADILNAGKPNKPYDDPSLVKPNQLRDIPQAIEVLHGSTMDDFDPKKLEAATRRLLNQKKIQKLANEAVLDIPTDNPYEIDILNYQLTQLTEAIQEEFFDYITEFKVRFDQDGNILVTRREYDTLSKILRATVKKIEKAEDESDLATVKNQLFKLNYMASLIEQYYLRPLTKNQVDRAKDVRDDMVVLRGMILDEFTRHLNWITARDPYWNYSREYGISEYGDPTKIHQKVLGSISTAIMSELK